MDKFVSISVNQGDAFFLERNNVKMLIDGGRSRNGFPKQFERIIGNEKLDVIVCTHADADHINGLLGYFDCGLQCNEVWLPGRWTSRLKDLLLNPGSFIEELASEIMSVDLSNNVNLENIIDNDNLKDSYESEEEVDDGEGFNMLYEAIEKSIGRIDSLYCYGLFSPLWIVVYEPEKYKMLIESIDVVNKIRELAMLAYHSGARIRWFEYHPFQAASGGEAYLEPVNSREIFKVSRYMSALNFLSLSKANKESLVFYSPGNDRSKGVLFSADSDYSFKQELPNVGDGCIVTSPHHGSESNEHAYSRLINDFNVTDETVFVRSDGRFKKRPGDTYKLMIGNKICTLCRHPEAERQNVILTASAKGWEKDKALSWCYCI